MKKWIVASIATLALVIPAFGTAAKAPNPYVLCGSPSCIGDNAPVTCDAAHYGATFWNQYDQHLYQCRYVNGSWQWVRT